MPQHDDNMKPADRVAFEAARRIDLGKTDSVKDAIQGAAEMLGIESSRVMPTPGRVRQHLQAMSMQQMGAEAYEQFVRGTLQGAAQVMALLETSDDTTKCLLVGRAARGLVDGPARIHIRAYTNRAIDDIMAELEQAEYSDVTATTVNTKHGRLNRIEFNDEGVEFAVTRCQPEMWPSRGEDLFTGKPVAIQTLPELDAAT